MTGRLIALPGAPVFDGTRSLCGGRLARLSSYGVVTIVEGKSPLPSDIDDWTVLQPASLLEETIERGKHRTFSYDASKSILLTDFPESGLIRPPLQDSTACLDGWTVLAHPAFAEVLKHRLDGATLLPLHLQPKVMDMEVDTLIRKGFVGAVINLSKEFAESLSGNDVDLTTLQLYTLMKKSMHSNVSGY